MTLFTACLLALSLSRPVLAASVTLGCDPDPLVNGNALVSAVGSAAATPATDIIDLSPGCTYTLYFPNNATDGGNGLPLVLDVVVSGKLIINGNGATINRNTAHGTPQFRILEALAGSDVALNDITISNGALSDGTPSFGAGIANAGTLTLTNCAFTDNTITGSGEGYGAGVLNFGGTITIANCTFTGNTISSSSSYGAALVNQGGPVSITNSTFKGNTVSGINGYGGAIGSSGTTDLIDSVVDGNSATGSNSYGGAFYVTYGEFNVTRTPVSGNTASGNVGNGGVAYVTGGTLTVTDSTLSGNSVSGGIIEVGGAISSSATVNILNSTLSNNTASGVSNGYGGGVFNQGTLNVQNSTFSGNAANGSSGYGGGVYNNSGTATVTDSIFSANTVSGDFSGGAGFYGAGTVTVNNSAIRDNVSTAIKGSNGGGILSVGTTTLNDTTVSGNSAQNGGGVFNGAALTLNNTIIANSIVGSDCELGGGTIDARNSLIEGGLTCINGINTNNRTGDPALNGDLTLADGSPAIDAGDNSLIPPGITTDLAGNPRIVSGVVDIGALESTTVIVPVPTATAAAGESAPASSPAPNVVCDDLNAQTGGSMTGHGSVQNVASGDQHGNSYCHVIAQDGRFLTSAAEIGSQRILDLGVVQAVDVVGLLPNGVPVVPFASPVRICLRGAGELLFLDAGTAERSARRLLTSSENGYRCADLPNAGTLVLVSGTSGVPEPPQPSVQPTTLSGTCRVTTTDAPINLRAEPSVSAAIIGKLPYDLTLTATARVPGWYRLIYLDRQGWASDRYLRAVGDCTP